MNHAAMNDTRRDAQFCKPAVVNMRQQARANIKTFATPPFMPAANLDDADTFKNIKNIMPVAGIAELDQATRAISDAKIDFSRMAFPHLLTGIELTAEQHPNALDVNAQYAASFPPVAPVPPNAHVAPQPPSAPPPVPAQAPQAQQAPVSSKLENAPAFLTPNPAVAAMMAAAVAPMSMSAGPPAMMNVSGGMTPIPPAMMTVHVSASMNNGFTSEMLQVSAPINMKSVPPGMVPVLAVPGITKNARVMVPPATQMMINTMSPAIAAENPYMMMNGAVESVNASEAAFAQAASTAQRNAQVPVVKLKPAPVSMPNAGVAAAAAAVVTAETCVANAEQGTGEAAPRAHPSRRGKKKRNQIRRTRAMSRSDPTVLSAVAAIKAEQRFAAVTPHSMLQARPMSPQVPPVPTIGPPMAAGMPTMPMTGSQMCHMRQMTPVMALPPDIVPAYARGPRRLLRQVGVNPGEALNTMDTGGGATVLLKEEEERKTVRAERNRHSAAASRERKKQQWQLAELTRQYRR